MVGTQPTPLKTARVFGRRAAGVAEPGILPEGLRPGAGLQRPGPLQGDLRNAKFLTMDLSLLCVAFLGGWFKGNQRGTHHFGVP